MMYYRCDCCGAEQEVLEIGARRTRTDPMGLDGQYRAPKEIHHLAKDLCAKCHDILVDIRDACMAEWHKELTARLESEAKKLQCGL